MAKQKTGPIHRSISLSLGYDPDDATETILADWKERTSRVCKPCWELKYCPYGPLVEQLPLLPSLRSGQIDHIEYLKKALETNTLGGRHQIDDARRKEIEETLSDPDFLLWIA